MRLGHPRIHRRITDSTNLDARALALAGAPSGTLVSANGQLAGRGRDGRRWHAPPGRALLCSLVLREPPALLALRAGVAVAQTIGAGTLLKWPNDVLLEDGRKVAGILIEGRPQERWAVIGIGVNVAVDPQQLPAELRERAGSMGLGPADVEPLLARLLAALASSLAAPAAEVLAGWRSRDALEGREISWGEPGQCARARGIDDSGALLIERPDGERLALSGGEVSLVRAVERNA